MEMLSASNRCPTVTSCDVCHGQTSTQPQGSVWFREFSPFPNEAATLEGHLASRAELSVVGSTDRGVMNRGGVSRVGTPSRDRSRQTDAQLSRLTTFAIVKHSRNHKGRCGSGNSPRSGKRQRHLKGILILGCCWVE